MCEFAEKLIAWLDQELPDQDARLVEQHLAKCPECRKRRAVYSEISSRLAAYCDAMAAGPAKRRRGRVALAGGAVAAAIGLFLLLPRTTVDRIPLLAPPAVHAPAIAWQTMPVHAQTVHRRPTRPAIPSQPAAWPSGETDVHIAIPADAIFPPGAFPEGFQFIADLSIAADGSPQGIRIIP